MKLFALFQRQSLKTFCKEESLTVFEDEGCPSVSTSQYVLTAPYPLQRELPQSTEGIGIPKVRYHGYCLRQMGFQQ